MGSVSSIEAVASPEVARPVIARAAKSTDASMSRISAAERLADGFMAPIVLTTGAATACSYQGIRCRLGKSANYRFRHPLLLPFVVAIRIHAIFSNAQHLSYRWRHTSRWSHWHQSVALGAPAHSAIMYFSMLLPAVSCNSHIDIIVIAHAMAMYIEIPNVL